MAREIQLRFPTDQAEAVRLQTLLCRRYGKPFVASEPESIVGFALKTLGKAPINGLRYPALGNSNGWHIWLGEFSSASDFFSPVHTSHLFEQLPEVVEFLGLSPGHRFLLAPNYVDVWYDENLLNLQTPLFGD
jgi:hypothetical protein